MNEVNIIIATITNLENAVVKAKRYNAVQIESMLGKICAARKELKEAGVNCKDKLAVEAYYAQKEEAAAESENESQTTDNDDSDESTEN